jgi:hypothetical protein
MYEQDTRIRLALISTRKAFQMCASTGLIAIMPKLDIIVIMIRPGIHSDVDQ